MKENPNLTFHDLHKNNNDDEFDIVSGLLNKTQKSISPKYFYDEVGSSLFDKITNLKDYYPTKKEIEILEDQNKEFFKILPASSSVIEFGSGSNKKIKRFLKALNSPREYIPIDISRDFLLKNAIKSAKNLLKKFSKVLEKDNFLVIGVDLQKNINLIEKAYNDSTGLTAKFNKNILNGINKICGPIFEEDDFSHRAFFNNEKSRIEMHLVSKKNQTINIFKKKIKIKVGETIHTENSYKYSIKSFTKLVESSGYEIIKVLKDKKSFFAVFFLKVKCS